MGVVVHSYGNRWNSKVESKNYPGFTNAIDLLEHCHQIGAGGIQVVVKRLDAGVCQKSEGPERETGSLPRRIYWHSTKNLKMFQNLSEEVVSAKEAGATVLRTVCSSGTTV